MKREKGLVSAIIPTFNRSKSLLERLVEIKNQTYQKIEIIVVDDCSNDDTEEVVKSFDFSRLKYIKLHKNSGYVSIPRNIGICNAIGEFIAPVDDDCHNFSHKFEILVSNFGEDDILVYGNRLDWRDGLLEEPRPIKNWNPLNGWGVDNSQIMYRASVYDNVPLIFPSKACDWHTAKHICQLGKIKYVENIISVYIIHNNNRSYRPDSEILKEPINPKQYSDYLKNNYNYEFDFTSVFT